MTADPCADGRCGWGIVARAGENEGDRRGSGEHAGSDEQARRGPIGAFQRVLIGGVLSVPLVTTLDGFQAVSRRAGLQQLKSAERSRDDGAGGRAQRYEAKGLVRTARRACLRRGKRGRWRESRRSLGSGLSTVRTSAHFCNLSGDVVRRLAGFEPDVLLVVSERVIALPGFPLRLREVVQDLGRMSGVVHGSKQMRGDLEVSTVVCLECFAEPAFGEFGPKCRGGYLGRRLVLRAARAGVHFVHLLGDVFGGLPGVELDVFLVVGESGTALPGLPLRLRKVVQDLWRMSDLVHCAKQMRSDLEVSALVGFECLVEPALGEFSPTGRGGPLGRGWLDRKGDGRRHLNDRQPAQKGAPLPHFTIGPMDPTPDTD